MQRFTKLLFSPSSYKHIWDKIKQSISLYSCSEQTGLDSEVSFTCFSDSVAPRATRRSSSMRWLYGVEILLLIKSLGRFQRKSSVFIRVQREEY